MSLGFKSYINTFTRVTQDTKSCIDHIFVKQSLSNGHLDIYSAVINNNTTDHYPVYLQIFNKINKRPPTLEKTITNFDHNKFKYLINQESWQHVTAENEATGAWNLFNKTFNDIPTCQMHNNKNHKN